MPAINPIPRENQNIIPYMMVYDVKKEVDFLSKAFGAELQFKLDRNDGSIMHAEVKIGKNIIMMGEPTPTFGPMPVAIYLYVEDCDAVFQSALKAGASLLSEVKTMLHAGERYGCVKDISNNIWWIASHVENISLEESQQRIKNMKS